MKMRFDVTVGLDQWQSFRLSVVNVPNRFAFLSRHICLTFYRFQTALIAIALPPAFLLKRCRL